MMNAEAALIWCPFPDAAAAQSVAEQLLTERLIACANIMPGVASVYRWQGAINTGSEVGVLFKTTQAALQDASARLEHLHPYDTPAIMGWPAEAAPDTTLNWLAQQVPVKGGAEGNG